jgi:hypothetical protein
MRSYRFLLHLYPKSFRNEYGEEMCHLFAMRLDGASRGLERALVWLAAIFEIVGNATAAHWDIFRSDLRHTRRTLARTRFYDHRHSHRGTRRRGHDRSVFGNRLHPVPSASIS